MAVFFTRRGQPPSLGKQLSDYAEGDIVQIPENGTPVEFYVAKHDYEKIINGSGRILVIRSESPGDQKWNDRRLNAYMDSSIDSWLNSQYKEKLDANVQNLIGSTKFYYTIGGGDSSVAILDRSIFIPSVTELGYSASNANTEGNVLPIASKVKKIYQWTRSPIKNTTDSAYWVDEYGPASSFAVCTGSRRILPMFTLPATTKFDPDTNIIIG